MADGNALSAARPVVCIDGQDHTDLTAGLLSLVIVETTSGLYRLEGLFGNWGAPGGATGFVYFDRRVLEFGKGIKIKLAGATLFDGQLTAIEARFPEGAPPQIGILAEDRLQELRMSRRTRSFADMSDADVFRQVASDHSLTPQINLSGSATHKVLAQTNQSDLAFLRERARRIDAEVWVEGTTLHAASRSSRSSGQPPKLALGARLREFSVIADLSHQRTKVTAGGWDVSSKSAIAADAEEAAINSELDNGESGAGILQAKLGERKEVVAHGASRTSAEAQAHAESWFRAISRRFVVGRGLAQTDAQLRVGTKVELEGLGPLFSGKYYLATVCHQFDATNGIRTEFTGERPGLGRP